MEVEGEKKKGFVSTDEFEEFQKKMMSTLSGIDRGLKALTLDEDEPAVKTSAQYCPQCHVATDDLYAHLKADPEKHGLVKSVEVTKKKTVTERLAEHDFFTCTDCRKMVDEHLSKMGLEIVKKSKVEEAPVCPECGSKKVKAWLGGWTCPEGCLVI